MLTTSKTVCNTLSDLLVAYGVSHAVVSPGSRNAPILRALAREPKITKHVVVDERTAAFVALGIAQHCGKPVALVCTSGTAMLNYSPALAEAYYQQIPLIVISADRLENQIDQNDSQTIRQFGAFANFVNASFHINSHDEGEIVNEQICKAIHSAISLPKGPVHINLPLGEPLYDMAERTTWANPITFPKQDFTIPEKELSELSNIYNKSPKVMIFVAQNQPSTELNDALNKLAKLPNTIVLTENIANLNVEGSICAIERSLSQMNEAQREEYAPDLLIYCGGAPVSRMLKQFLRSIPAVEQWRVGVDRNKIDTMHHLTRSINSTPEQFFGQLAEKTMPIESNYAQMWQALNANATAAQEQFLSDAPWSDIKAMQIILQSIPQGYALQISNGTSIRYTQLFDNYQLPYCHCNRGVSGIDGSTSTALGFSLVGDEQTLLITGDMSFGYDIGGLAAQVPNRRLKIIVLDNAGGEIFRFIKGASTLPELEEYLAVNRRQPIQKYADTFGFKYYEAESMESLKTALPAFYSTSDCAILAVKTDPQTTAQTFRNYYKRNK